MPRRPVAPKSDEGGSATKTECTHYHQRVTKMILQLKRCQIFGKLNNSVMSHKLGFNVGLLDTPEQLKSVLNLYRQDKKTLGFLPDGAFEDRAGKKQILIAQTTNGICVGYLLYRVSKGKASIVHLCVSQQYRSHGIAKALVELLKLETKHLLGIGLYCRPEYSANKIWPKFNFVPRNEKIGRGQDSTKLTYWWFDFNQTDLFSLADNRAEEERICVVIDANVFFDIHTRDTDESEDSKALLQPWLQESIELCLTDEIHNDIHRANDSKKSQHGISLATRHRHIKSNPTEFSKVLEALKRQLAPSKNNRDESDIRHLSHAVATGAKFFVTRDNDLIDRSEQLYEKNGLSVLLPASLINQLDTLQRENDYRPARLAGTSCPDELLKSEVVSKVAEVFRLQGEKQSQLEKRLNHWIAKPREFECRISSTSNGTLVVLWAFARSNARSAEIPLLRISHDSLAPTVARHILRMAIEKTAKASAIILSVLDQNLHPSLVSALQEMGFVFGDKHWVKLLGGGLISFPELKHRATECLQLVPDAPLQKRISQLLDGYAHQVDALTASKIEHLFWPAKIESAPIPTYIVPIQPRWAEHFFDKELGSQVLIGLRTDLHLGIEGVYYRSTKGPCLAAPGRILWYVSQGDENEGAMAIKACSRLENVIIAPAKELYRRFRRLGVYERRDVIKVANGKPEAEIMALHFTMTEHFNVPVTLAWLNTQGIKGNFVGPRKIPPEKFSAIYRKGFNLV